jgi:hypothetical protein
MTDRHLGDGALQALEGRKRALPGRARDDQQEFLASVTSQCIGSPYR